MYALSLAEQVCNSSSGRHIRTSNALDVSVYHAAAAAAAVAVPSEARVRFLNEVKAAVQASAAVA
jgi:hypothetical protein